MDNYFVKLFNVNVNDKIEKKNGLSYVSWPFAWAEVKKQHPDATYTIYENKDGWFYHTDGKTCWVKTGLTVNGIEHIEMLPVMDYKNRSIPVDCVTSMDVNKAIQRSLTKAAARHGLGLYVYAGEDLPEDEAEARKQEKETAKNTQKTPRIAPKADVTMASTVPAMEEPETAESFRKAAWRKFGADFADPSGEKLMAFRTALIAGGLIEDIPLKQMSLEQIKDFFQKVYDNYGDMQEAG